jgi:hypothetical protein
VPYTSRTLPTLPPDFVVHCLAGGEWIDAKTIPLVYRGLKLNGATYSHGHPFSVIEDLGLFFSIIRKNVHARNLELAEALAASMVERDWHHNSIETLILPLATPIMENLRICQISPKTTYSLDTYSLIDRPDLHEFAKGAYVMPDTPTIVYRKPVRADIMILFLVLKQRSMITRSTRLVNSPEALLVMPVAILRRIRCQEGWSRTLSWK